MTPMKCWRAILILFLVVSPCAAQIDTKPGEARFDAQAYGRRTDAFRRLLFELRFQPLPSFGDLQLEKPSESLFIMLGNPSCLNDRNFPEGLRDFVEQGGAVLIATDKETKDNAGSMLKDLAGVSVTGKRLFIRWPLAEDGAINRYDNSEHCPFVEPIADLRDAIRSMSVLGTLASLLGTGDRPDLFRRDPQPGSKHLDVATNAPSYLIETERLPRGIYRLARLPGSCQDESKFDIPILRKNEPATRNFVDEAGPLFAVGGTVGKGRVLVLADHSIFINRMMLFSDNKNMEFAVNCLHWLRGGSSSPLEILQAAKTNPDALKQLAGQRKNVLFWDDGRIQTDFEVPLKKVSLPSPLGSEPAIVSAIDKTIVRLEEEDYFNRQLLETMDDWPGGRNRVIRNVVYLLTLAALGLLAYRFIWRTRYRSEYAVATLVDAVRKHEPTLPLLDQRRRALLRLGNVWEMGQRLAREFFDSAGVPLREASPPRVVMANGSWWQRWRVRRRVARLWRLACNTAPVSLSPAALRHRLRELEELKTAQANGTIRLT